MFQYFCFVKMVKTHCVKTYSFRPLRKAIEGEREAGTPRLNATVLSALPPPPPPPPSIPCVQGREKARQATCVYLFTPKMSLPSILHLCLYFPLLQLSVVFAGYRRGKRRGNIIRRFLRFLFWPAVYSIYIMRNFTPLTQGSLSLSKGGKKHMYCTVCALEEEEEEAATRMFAKGSGRKEKRGREGGRRNLAQKREKEERKEEAEKQTCFSFPLFLLSDFIGISALPPPPLHTLPPSFAPSFHTCLQEGKRKTGGTLGPLLSASASHEFAVY